MESELCPEQFMGDMFQEGLEWKNNTDVNWSIEHICIQLIQFKGYSSLIDRLTFEDQVICIRSPHT